MVQPSINQIDMVQINRALRDLYQGLTQLQTQVLNPSVPSQPGPSIAAGGIIQGDHLTRILLYNPVANKGCIYIETDRSNVTYYSNGLIWRYLGGVHSCALADRPTDLGTDDAGFLLHTTTYNHQHRWTGTAWTWALSDPGSNYIAGFTANPGTGWKLCNGSGTFTYERADCTTATATIPDATVGAYLKFAAAYTTTVQAAVAPTITGTTTSDSAGTPAGSIVSVFTGGSDTLGSVDVQSGSGESAAPGGDSVTSSGTVASTFTGSPMAGHDHDLTASAGTNGEPPHWNLLPYFRQ